MQLKFRKHELFLIVLLPLAVLFGRSWMAGLPNRVEAGPRTVAVRFEPVSLGARAFLPLRLAGAWIVRIDDPRFGGISALAVDGSGLLALTDSGVLMRVPKPGGSQQAAMFDELPAGPGDAGFKRNRDSEALVRDPGGRGWWVAFEIRHSLWLYDPGFARALARIDLRGFGWRANKGVEGLAAHGGDLLLFPESGREIVRVAEGRMARSRLGESRSRIADAEALPDGRLVALERQPTALGFRNRLAWIERAGGGYRISGRADLPVGLLDNFEALAAEPIAGRTRLWLMTDDNFNRWQRTLLLAVDIPSRSRAD